MKIISRADAKAQGFMRYFTGKPCKHGHVVERIVSNKGCVQCRALINSVYRKKDPALWRRKKSDWYKNNVEKTYTRSRDWKKRNPERARAIWVARRRRKFFNEKSALVDAGLQSASDRGSLMDEREAIEIFKSQHNAFEFLNEG